MKYIAVIKNEDFGLENVKLNNPRERMAARSIVINEDNKIAVFNKSKKNEYKLPGGGVEDGEDLYEACKREVLEETGCEIEILYKLGVTLEERSRDNFKQISHVFVSRVVNDTKNLHLTKKENVEGGRMIWASTEEALKLITDCFNNLKPSEYEDLYHTRFMVMRDRKILEYYMEKNK